MRFPREGGRGDEDMRKAHGLIVAAAFLAFCATGRQPPLSDSPAIAFPCEWPGSPGFSGNIDTQGIIDPSGVCFYPPARTLFIVSDEGELYEIRTDGTPLSYMKIPGDLEEITLDPQSGLMYIAVEGEDVILEFDPAKREILRTFHIDHEFQGNPHFLKRDPDRYDNGIESLAFVPDARHPEGGTFFAGNQEDPPCILELSVPLKSGLGPIGEAKILRVLPTRLRDPGAMLYDPETRLLNVVSDSDNILLEITLDGKIVGEFAFPGNSQEGIAMDDEGFIYIAQDSGGIIKLKDLRKKFR